MQILKKGRAERESAAKKTVLAEDLVPSTHTVGSQSPLTPKPGDAMFFSGLCRNDTQVVHTYIE